MQEVTIIGGGLAGSEAAWQISKQGIRVKLIEMRPKVMTKAHRTDSLAELVCSNSFRGVDLSNAVGLLKEELRKLGSLIMEAADYAKVPAGGALAVDRVLFSSYVTDKLKNNPLIEIVTDEVCDIPASSKQNPVIIATGPLTSKPLCTAIQKLTGNENLAFFDAISPVILRDSLNMDELFWQSRYDKGDGADYLNIPLSRETYYEFVEAVSSAEKFGGHEEVESDFVDNIRPFEGCMPIEEMIARGPDTLLFGPMKPVGLRDPKTNLRPYAVIQLRQDDKAGTLWSMVGFQTRLKHPEQKRIFRSLPGLENAEFVRLGSVHRNTFIDSPTCLEATLQTRTKEGLFFAGQITGVEGYVESTAGGLLAGLNASRLLHNRELLTFPDSTAIGALMAYISDKERTHFQPMNISFGLMKNYSQTEELPKPKKVSKKDKRLNTALEALKLVDNIIANSTN